MPTIQHFNRDEITDGNANAGTPRIQRLKNLISGAAWGNKNKINLIYWKQDASAPGGGHWVAWEDPDALTAAGIDVAQD